jgi:hypothetical protein
LHCDSSYYGWGAVLNEQLETRGILSHADQHQHIVSKYLTAVRLLIRSLLPLLRGRKVRMDEDNQAMVVVLIDPIAMKDEIRKLWNLIDTYNINIRARYIRSAANS